MAIHKVTAALGQGTIEIETGKLAKLADGAVTVRLGDTVVIVTAVSATKVKDGQDWFPLSVEYKEKASAAGRLPGGYFKREGRPTEKEILTCRMTDRPLRPLFPKGYLYETQVVALLLSADGENDPDILAINGASAALCVSDIPFAGPVGAVRIGRVDGNFIVNPTQTERLDSDLDLVYVGNATDVIMIEGAANELPEAEFVKAL
ncbi:MAG: Polyribonucleotide nucleotidyltransferase, partial [Verrucomicrobiaceae bacterium]|nr:Polyribonucleotide nucleotidyltransferase [Verrucomicrobiaceae bacterium]